MLGGDSITTMPHFHSAFDLSELHQSTWFEYPVIVKGFIPSMGEDIWHGHWLILGFSYGLPPPALRIAAGASLWISQSTFSAVSSANNLVDCWYGACALHKSKIQLEDPLV